MKNRFEYSELSKAKISDSRNAVISNCSEGGFTIAQQLEAIEGDRVTSVFMKGAFHVDDINGLYNFRDAINLAIKLYEEKSKQNEMWDN